MGAHAIFIQDKNGDVQRPWTSNGYSIAEKLEHDTEFDFEVIADGPLRAIIKSKISNWGLV